MLAVEGIAQRIEGPLPAGGYDLQAAERLEIALLGEEFRVGAAAALAVPDRRPRVPVRLQYHQCRLFAELVEDGCDLLVGRSSGAHTIRTITVRGSGTCVPTVGLGRGLLRPSTDYSATRGAGASRRTQRPSCQAAVLPTAWAATRRSSGENRLTSRAVPDVSRRNGGPSVREPRTNAPPKQDLRRAKKDQMETDTAGGSLERAQSPSLVGGSWSAIANSRRNHLLTCAVGQAH